MCRQYKINDYNLQRGLAGGKRGSGRKCLGGNWRRDRSIICEIRNGWVVGGLSACVWSGFLAERKDIVNKKKIWIDFLFSSSTKIHSLWEYNRILFVPPKNTYISFFFSGSRIIMYENGISMKIVAKGKWYKIFHQVTRVWKKNRKNIVIWDAVGEVLKRENLYRFLMMISGDLFHES